MTIRVAINGFGRIGRNVLRAHYEYAKQHDVEIVAINSPGDLAVNAHLLKYDTVHGRFTTPVETDGKDMIVGGDRIHVFKTRDPRELPRADLGVDLVMECTGAFKRSLDGAYRIRCEESAAFGPWQDRGRDGGLRR